MSIEGTSHIDVNSLPRIPVRLLYHNGYYDGPLSGMCEVDGERMYTTKASSIGPTWHFD